MILVYMVLGTIGQIIEAKEQPRPIEVANDFLVDDVLDELRTIQKKIEREMPHGIEAWA